MDKYFAENNLNAKDVKYIWIDTEGFEAKVLLGAKNILKENPAPVFMEFNPSCYKRAGNYGSWINLLEELYEGYVLVQDALRTGIVDVRPIVDLWNYENAQKQIGDIFLIHKLLR